MTDFSICLGVSCWTFSTAVDLRPRSFFMRLHITDSKIWWSYVIHCMLCHGFLAISDLTALTRARVHTIHALPAPWCLEESPASLNRFFMICSVLWVTLKLCAMMVGILPASYAWEFFATILPCLITRLLAVQFQQLVYQMKPPFSLWPLHRVVN